MKKFNFPPPGDLKQQAVNWHVMNGAHACKEYEVFQFDTPSAAGWDGVSDYWGTYALLGPVVWFSITMVGTDVNWFPGSTTYLPIAIARRQGTQTQQYGLSFPIYANGYWPDNGFGTPHGAGTNLGTTLAAHFATPLASGYSNINISGWYFR